MPMRRQAPVNGCLGFMRLHSTYTRLAPADSDASNRLRRVMWAAAAICSLVAIVAVAAGAGGGGGGGGCGDAVVFNFGDSNSDTGGVQAAHGYILPYPQGRGFFGRPAGRLCDGRLVIDFLCESLNIGYLSPFLQSLGSNYTHGANFAIAGATVLPRDALFTLSVQVQQFLYFKSRSLDLISRGWRDLVDERGFKNAMYIIDIGQNDINDFLAYLPYDQVLAKLPPILSEIASAIWTLYNSGARNFWVHGTGSLGCLPQKVAIPRSNNDDVDNNGCMKSYNDAARVFNSQLSNLTEELNRELKDAMVVFTDVHAIKYDLVANHMKYGFDKPLMTCCGHGGPPYNYDPNVPCMSSGCQVCDNGSKFISWDGVHYTEAANAIVAAKILSNAYSKPNIRFDHFCNT